MTKKDDDSCLREVTNLRNMFVRKMNTVDISKKDIYDSIDVNSVWNNSSNLQKKCIFALVFQKCT